MGDDVFWLEADRQDFGKDVKRRARDFVTGVQRGTRPVETLSVPPDDMVLLLMMFSRIFGRAVGIGSCRSTRYVPWKEATRVKGCLQASSEQRCMRSEPFTNRSPTIINRSIRKSTASATAHHNPVHRYKQMDRQNEIGSVCYFSSRIEKNLSTYTLPV